MYDSPVGKLNNNTIDYNICNKWECSKNNDAIPFIFIDLAWYVQQKSVRTV